MNLKELMINFIKSEKLSSTNCKNMHLKEFKAFCKEIDEKIEVNCIFAPPDNHPNDFFAYRNLKFQKFK